MNRTLLVGLSLFFGGSLALMATAKPRPEMHKATVDGRRYHVFRLGGGVYRVERKDGDVTSALMVFSQEKPLHVEGDPELVEQLKADIYKFPPDLFQAIAPPPADSVVDYSDEE